MRTSVKELYHIFLFILLVMLIEIWRWWFKDMPILFLLTLLLALLHDLLIFTLMMIFFNLILALLFANELLLILSLLIANILFVQLVISIYRLAKIVFLRLHLLLLTSLNLIFLNAFQEQFLFLLQLF